MGTSLLFLWFKYQAITATIPYKLLLECQSNGNLKELAYFIGFKYSYVNSTLYDTTNQKLTDSPICGKTKARQLFKFFITEGWAERNHILKGDIHFKPFTKSRNTFTLTYTNPKDIYRLLCLELLAIKQRQFNYKSRIAKNLNNPTSKLDYSKARKQSKKYQFRDGFVNNGLNLSYLSLARLFNTSITNAQRIVESLAKDAFLTKSRQNKTTSIPNSLINEVKGVFFKGKDGFLIQRLSNNYTLTCC